MLDGFVFHHLQCLPWLIVIEFEQRGYRTHLLSPQLGFLALALNDDNFICEELTKARDGASSTRLCFCFASKDMDESGLGKKQLPEGVSE